MEPERDDIAIESEAMLAADGDCDDVAIEIEADGNRDDIAIEIEVILGNAQPLFTTKCCIYRVPHEIRKFKQDAYTPTIVSIGPFHHGDSKLLPMEGHKQIYCLKFIERSRSGVSLDDFVSCVQELEPKVRQCYADNIKLSKEELVKVILVDCGFVIEIFLRYCFGGWTEDDVIFSTQRLRVSIRFDLLLLENQLPFFILEKLYNLAFLSSLNEDMDPSFLTLALGYFQGYIGKNLSSTCTVAHFTDLLRTSHLQMQPPNRRPPNTVPGGLVNLYSATELNEAGVKFRVNDRSESFLDLQFSGSYLEIPQIKVTDSTEMLLRNMVALEQYHYPEETYIAGYMMLINFLINTDKDVDILVKNGIIVNWLGDSNAVAELFTGFGKHIVSDLNGDYLRIVNELNAYYKHPLHSKMATLKRDYCNTPWKTVASFAGIALLVLTIIQTVFSIIK